MVHKKTMCNYKINNILKMNTIAQDINYKLNLTYFTLTKVQLGNKVQLPRFPKVK